MTKERNATERTTKTRPTVPPPDVILGHKPSLLFLLGPRIARQQSCPEILASAALAVFWRGPRVSTPPDLHPRVEVLDPKCFSS